MQDVTPLLQAIAARMRQALGARFAEGGEPAWKPLRPSTIAAKALAGMPALTKKGNVPRRLKQQGNFGPGNILIASGALRDSYRLKYGRGNVEVIDAKAATVTVGSRLPYARFHQKGTAAYIIAAKAFRGKRKGMLAFTGSSGQMVFRASVHHPGLPKRPVALTQEERKDLAQMVRDWMSGKDITRAA